MSRGVHTFLLLSAEVQRPRFRARVSGSDYRRCSQRYIVPILAVSLAHGLRFTFTDLYYTMVCCCRGHHTILNHGHVPPPTMCQMAYL